MLEKRGNPVKEIERYQFNWMTMRSAAMLSDGSDLDAFKKTIAKNAKFKDLVKKMESLLPLVELAAACTGDDAAKAKCFGEKLKDNNPDIREKAAWELTRLAPDAARPVILANLETQFLDTRNILAGGVYQMRGADAAKTVQTILDKKESGPDFKNSAVRLRLLKAFVTNNPK